MKYLLNYEATRLLVFLNTVESFKDKYQITCEFLLQNLIELSQKLKTCLKYNAEKGAIK